MWRITLNVMEEQVRTDADDCLGHGTNRRTPTMVSITLSLPPKSQLNQDSRRHTCRRGLRRIMKIAYTHRVPVTPFSGGPSLEGHITCPFGGICIDLSRMVKVLEVHEADSDAAVQAGV